MKRRHDSYYRVVLAYPCQLTKIKFARTKKPIRATHPWDVLINYIWMFFKFLQHTNVYRETRRHVPLQHRLGITANSLLSAVQQIPSVVLCMFCAAKYALLYKYGAAIVTLVRGSKKSVATAVNVERSLFCLN